MGRHVFHSRAKSLHSIPPFERPFQEPQPKGIMKRRELDTTDRMLYQEPPSMRVVPWTPSARSLSRSVRGGGYETTERFEIQKRSEEVERSTNRQSRSRHRSASGLDWKRSSSTADFGDRLSLGYSNTPYVEMPPTPPRTPSQFRRRESDFGESAWRTESHVDAWRRHEAPRWEETFSTLPRYDSWYGRVVSGTQPRRLRRIGPPYESSYSNEFS
uniref:Uncharacterized protein n=1 Tax=Steinernema glaseri TaxID=37863 RepID=A0A1I7ZH25_9BILA